MALFLPERGRARLLQRLRAPARRAGVLGQLLAAHHHAGAEQPEGAEAKQEPVCHSAAERKATEELFHDHLLPGYVFLGHVRIRVCTRL